jgi:hypothetical protein
MRRVGREPLQLQECLLESFQQAIQRPRHVSQFVVRILNHDPFVQTARRHLLRPSRHLTSRAGGCIGRP